MTIGIGIIGCGKVAQVRHLPEYADNPNARLVGYYDLNLERAEEIALQYGGKAYPSIEAMLSDPAIDAVSVLSSNNTHAEISIAAMEAGKDVLCEKPMAITLEQCEAMVATAKRTGRQLMIGQNQRLAKAHAKAKELIEKGEIGTPLTFRTTFSHAGPESWAIDGRSSWFFDKSKAIFGAMADLGIHKTDLIQYLLGSRICDVTACMTTIDKRDESGELVGVDDNAIAIYHMESGALGTMTASWTKYGHEDNSTVIDGTKGSMKIYYDPAHSLIVEYRNGEQALWDIDQIQTNDNQSKSGVIDLFIDALVHKTPVSISGADVLPAMRAVFACEQSALQGKTIHIDHA